MANELIKQMALLIWIAKILAARNIITAKLMEVLDAGLAEATSTVAKISEVVCPPCQTALSLMEPRVRNETLAGHLPTRLKGLDEALCGGIPFGVLTELIGPAGIGKTQFCLKLSWLASLPANCGGLDGRVIHIDVEFKFSSRSLIEIGVESFPEIFHKKGMAREIKVSLLQQQVKLLVIDSMAALVLEGSLAEFARIPVVVTNQEDLKLVMKLVCIPFKSRTEKRKNPATYDSHLVAALGINWAHAVTIRLVLEAKSGQRFIKLAKSPISPPLAFRFNVVRDSSAG